MRIYLLIGKFCAKNKKECNFNKNLTQFVFFNGGDVPNVINRRCQPLLKPEKFYSNSFGDFCHFQR